MANVLYVRSPDQIMDPVTLKSKNYNTEIN
jgi:hypothetical protein